HGVRGMVNTYLDKWFPEGRAPVHVDRGYYTRKYQQAALDISEGRYNNETDHFIKCGQFQGYYPRSVYEENS
ncbi:hypothetical protein, partial [Zymomonas mobilis]|uniref:hypothetical protein n=1 Tax=Zymomonas mobilis TaxID=542 RepID=UPI0039EACA0B